MSGSKELPKKVEGYIKLIDGAAADPREEYYYRQQYNDLKKQLNGVRGHCRETTDSEILEGLSFLERLLLAVQRALYGPKN